MFAAAAVVVFVVSHSVVLAAVVGVVSFAVVFIALMFIYVFFQPSQFNGLKSILVINTSAKKVYILSFQTAKHSE